MTHSADVTFSKLAKGTLSNGMASQNAAPATAHRMAITTLGAMCPDWVLSNRLLVAHISAQQRAAHSARDTFNI